MVTLEGLTVEQEVSKTSKLDKQTFSAQQYEELRHSGSERYVFSTEQHSWSQIERLFESIAALPSLDTLEFILYGYNYGEKCLFHSIMGMHQSLARFAQRNRFQKIALHFRPTDLWRGHETETLKSKFLRALLERKPFFEELTDRNGFIVIDACRNLRVQPLSG